MDSKEQTSTKFESKHQTFPSFKKRHFQNMLTRPGPGDLGPVILCYSITCMHYKYILLHKSNGVDAFDCFISHFPLNIFAKFPVLTSSPSLTAISSSICQGCSRCKIVNPVMCFYSRRLTVAARAVIARSPLRVLAKT